MITSIARNMAMLLVLTGCSTLPEKPPGKAGASENPSPDSVQESTLVEVPNDPTPETQFSQVPAYSGSPTERRASEDEDLKSRLPSSKVGMNIHDMPIGRFINEVFGNILGLSFQIDSTLNEREDLVTVRAAEEKTHYELFRLARTLLLDYGVGVQVKDDYVRFFPATDPDTTEPPLFVTGASLPEVPATHRAIFQFVQVKVLPVATVASWIVTAFKGTDLVVQSDPMSNSIILRGPRDIVAHAAETVEIVDRPNMRGKYSVHIKPSFVDAESMSAMLSEVLQSEGFSVTTRPPFGAAIILPMRPTNSVVVFTADQLILDHVKKWAIELDQPTKQHANDDFFYYQVKNTSAKDLAETLSGLSGGSGSSSEDKGQALSTSILVDNNRNGLIFTGSSNWKSLLPIVQAMDRPPRLVHVEVTVASVTLTDDTDIGVAWLFNENKGRFSGVGKTDFGLGGSGFTYTLNNSGQIRFALNALSQDQRVSILSKPSILVKSGDMATIDVGQEVPIITSQAQSVDAVDAPVLQSITYRKTGVLLEVEPTVHSENQVDLIVRQEVSEVLDGVSSSVESPSIFNRSVSTTLTLRDGGAVILGGLISGSTNKGSSKVPFLGNIPGLGALFSTSGNQETRSELILVIQAYIVDIQQKDWDFNEHLRSKLNLLEIENLELN